MNIIGPFQEALPPEAKIHSQLQLNRIWKCLCVCLKTLDILETFKIMGFGWNVVHLFLRWISEESLLIFQKFWFLGLGDKFIVRTRLAPCQLCIAPKIIRFDWNLAHLFFKQIPGEFFSFLKNIYFCGSFDEFLLLNWFLSLQPAQK